MEIKILIFVIGVFVTFLFFNAVFSYDRKCRTKDWMMNLPSWYDPFK